MEYKLNVQWVLWGSTGGKLALGCNWPAIYIYITG